MSNFSLCWIDHSRMTGLKTPIVCRNTVRLQQEDYSILLLDDRVGFLLLLWIKLILQVFMSEDNLTVAVKPLTGVLMWEIYNEGRLPYENRTNGEVVESLNAGLRLLKPRLAPNAVYSLMEWCWKEVGMSPVKQLPNHKPYKFRALIGNRLCFSETRRSSVLCCSPAWTGCLVWPLNQVKIWKYV